MGLRRLVTVGLLGYGAYRWSVRAAPPTRVAVAPGETDAGGFGRLRNAGPAAMAGDRVYHARNESLLASDPRETF